MARRVSPPCTTAGRQASAGGAPEATIRRYGWAAEPLPFGDAQPAPRLTKEEPRVPQPGLFHFLGPGG